MMRFVLFLSTLVLLVSSTEEDLGGVDCYGEFGDLEGVQRNRMDRFLSRVLNHRGMTKLAIRLVKRAVNDENSMLRGLLGKFGQNLKSDDFDEREPTANVDSRFMAILNLVYGPGKTVISFLWKYGYLPKILNLSKKGADGYSGSISPCALTNAVMEFQRFHSISPINGILTKETREMMAKDRCGNVDVKCETQECLAEDGELDDEDVGPSEDSNHGYLRRKRFAVKSKLWKGNKAGKIKLNFWYENMYNPNDVGKEGHERMTEAEVRYYVEKGFAAWTKYTNIQLTEVKRKRDADVKIYFGQDMHNENKASSSFDGAGGVLAHMYYPRNGRMHFDQAENFSGSQTKGVNLYFVAAHEMGHGLGIEHSRKKSAAMYPYYTGYKSPMLDQDDIDAIQSLYGTTPGRLINLFDYSAVRAQDPDGDW